MNPKTVFIIIISVLITIVLMKNTDEMQFWFFGETTIPKLGVLGIMFLTGAVIGFMLGRPKKPTILNNVDFEKEISTDKPLTQYLTDEDRDYIN
ncbi:MAG: hypothetical protein H7096_09085 [Flavobacterium sp.]|nr:hypothetical protein [Pedobacter sp.]